MFAFVSKMKCREDVDRRELERDRLKKTTRRTQGDVEERGGGGGGGGGGGFCFI